MPYARGDVRKRPDLWSYISFSAAPSSADGALPTTRDDDDRFEKVGRRYSGRMEAAWNTSRDRRRITPRGQYIKVGGIIAAVVLLFYFLSPRPASSGARDTSGGQAGSALSGVTAKCKTPHSPSKPLMQYALMIDAGSTGSRIHVYPFNNCGPTPELEEETFVQTEKKEGGSGLSSYDADAEGAAKSLDVLMNVALQKVPQEYQSCTPVAVKATAGLRKLGTAKSERILAEVRKRLETAYPFPVVAADKHGVEVMDGKDEGVYAWITTNYLLGKIGKTDKSPTAAVFDLGGGSTQIVFEPTFPNESGGMPAKLEEGDHKYELSFGGRDFTLYQHSYLGYGLMAARENLHQLVLLNAFEKAPSGDRSWLSKPIANPCIQPGQSREVEVELPASHPLGDKATVTMQGPAQGSEKECLALAEATLHKGDECKLSPCAFQGVYQPSLATTFAREDVYLFSYFYDRISPLGMPDAFTLNDLAALAGKVCAGEAGWGSFKAIGGALEELRGRPEHCLDLNFMLALLNKGYDMPMTRQVKIAKKIDDRELGWCLGASLPLLSQESGWTCKIKEATR